MLRLPHRFNKLAASCHRLANLVTDLPVLSQDLQSCHGFSSLGTDFLVLSQTYQAFRRLIRLVARLVNIHINTKIYSWNRKEHTLAQVYHKHARLVTNLLGLRPDWRQNFTHRIGTTVFVLKLATNLPSLWVCSWRYTTQSYTHESEISYSCSGLSQTCQACSSLIGLTARLV